MSAAGSAYEAEVAAKKAEEERVAAEVAAVKQKEEDERIAAEELDKQGDGQTDTNDESEYNYE